MVKREVLSVAVQEVLSIVAAGARVGTIEAATNTTKVVYTTTIVAVSGMQQHGSPSLHR